MTSIDPEPLELCNCIPERRRDSMSRHDRQGHTRFTIGVDYVEFFHCAKQSSWPPNSHREPVPHQVLGPPAVPSSGGPTAYPQPTT